MTALIAAVFIASLLGSMHCAGMCGAFVAFAVNNDGKPQASRAALNAAYNTGRLMTYVLLGAIAGSLGAALDLGASMLGLQRGAAIAAGAMMIAFGVVAIARSSGVRLPRIPVPLVLQRVVSSGHRIAFDLPPIARATVVGLLTTLLPCGWLYAFAITAAGTGSPVLGGLTMAVFWLGTLPVLLALGVGVQALSGALRKHLPLATSLLIVVVGLWTIVGRTTMPALATKSTDVPVSIQHATQRVLLIDAEELPCCHDE